MNPMEAEYTRNGTTTRFTIGLQVREDGTVGPPRTTQLSHRNCASGPVDVFDLVLEEVIDELDLAVYRVIEKPLT